MRDEGESAAPSEEIPASFEEQKRALDSQVLDLLVQRRSLIACEAFERTRRNQDLASPLSAAQTTLQEIVEAARERGLDPKLIESVFREVVADGERVFLAAAASAVAQPAVQHTVLRISRQKELSETLVVSALVEVTGIEGAIGDERQAPDLPTTLALVASGGVRFGFVSCNLARFDELARLVELLVRTELKVVYNTPIESPEDLEEQSAASGNLIVVAREFTDPSPTVNWSSWIFLRVPETRSVQSTDLLIRSLLTARRYRLDTSHLHSFPGMSYDGFSYERDAKGLETRPHYSQRGSRAFLIDARRSPGPEILGQLASELLELGCSAQVLGCIPRSPATVGLSPENPITRTTTLLSKLSSSDSPSGIEVTHSVRRGIHSLRDTKNEL